MNKLTKVETLYVPISAASKNTDAVVSNNGETFYTYVEEQNNKYILSEKEIQELEIQFSPFDENKSIINIKTNFKGEFDEYPVDFMDEWGNQLMKLI